MIRLTASEVARILRRNRHWVYITAKKLGFQVNGFLSFDDLLKLTEHSFKNHRYEQYPYAELADAKFVRIVKESSSSEILKRSLGGRVSFDDYCETAIAMKSIFFNRDMRVILFFTAKNLGIKYKRSLFKEFVYKKTCDLISHDSNKLTHFFDFTDPKSENHPDISKELLPKILSHLQASKKN